MPDTTCYELILTLRQQGFSWRRLPAAVADRERLAYEVGGPRDWYTGGFTVHPQYLQALLQAETLQPKGVTSIPHWSRNPATFYTALLKGEDKPHRPRAAPAALEADVDPQEMGWRPKRARRGAPLARNINEDQLVAEAEGEGGSHVQEEEDDADEEEVQPAQEVADEENENTGNGYKFQKKKFKGGKLESFFNLTSFEKIYTNQQNARFIYLLTF